MFQLGDVVPEHILECTLQVEQGAATTELKATVKGLLDVFEKMERGAKYDKVNGLEVVNALLANLVQAHLYLRLFLFRIGLQIWLEALRYLAFKLVCTLRNLAFVFKFILLLLHPVKDVVVCFFAIHRDCGF